MLIATAVFTAVWAGFLLERSISELLPEIAYRLVNLVALGVGVAWLIWSLRDEKHQLGLGLAGSLLCLYGWQTAIYEFDLAGWETGRANVARWGTAGIFLIGLLWWVWLVDRLSRRRRAATTVAADPQSAPTPQRWAWNPFNETSWYYGRPKNKKLNQSLASLVSYTIAFSLMFLILTNLRGCQEIYELPSGGGEAKPLVQQVKIKKVIRKKFVVNPYSAIKFEERVIDDVNLQLNELTEHTYTIGQGEGAGAGFGSGTPGGQVRFIRLEYSGGDWDQDFGVGGDLNVLHEYAIRTGHKTAKRTESRRISDLESFRTGPAMVYITGQKNISLSNNEVKALRKFLLDRHGMIFADNGGSRHFHNQFLAMMNRVIPEVQPVAVPLDDTIHRVPFSIPFLPYVAPHGGKDALGWYKDGRWICYYHPGDIGDAWSDGHAGVKAEVWEGCYQLGINVIFYAHAEFDKWTRAQQKDD
ncbi:hypothetical protein Pla8534_07250 [Lignipirellula cremea]|uniref:DUF4159 domain-containing protein n=2 Tax=Lignipirellula cremea TaxID=2528010 RepID=A0A518DMA6_9BACT|nr:hypothetical protein Pla8534_07250 [Lignipirellula cremea]